MSEPAFEKRTESPSGKTEGKALEKTPNADVQKCLDYLSGPFACTAEEKAQAELFLNAHVGQAKEFAKVVTHCESTGKVDWLGDNVSLPLKSTSIAELCQKPELIQLTKTEVAAKTETVAAKTETVAAKTEIETSKDKAKELRTVSELMDKLPSGLSQKFGDRLKDWEANKLSSTEKTALARDILSDLKKSFEDAKANGGDTAKAAEDLKFFAEKFRDLGVISHQDFRDLFKNDSQKSGPDTNKSPADGRTALVGNFNSTGDGRTFFALDRTYPGV